MIKKRFDMLTPKELYEIIKLRMQVFVIEQNCCYQDLDDVDYISTHYFLLNEENKVVSYARFIPSGIKYETASIGRVITDKAYRKKGLSLSIIKEMIGDNKEPITISAQVQAVDFYKKIGFKKIGDIYLEDGIPHIKMILN